MKILKIVFVSVLFLLTSACGGGGSDAISANTQSDFSGTWTGNLSGTAFVFSIVQTGSNFTMTRTSPASTGITYTGVVNGKSAQVITYFNGVQGATSTMALTNVNAASLTIDSCAPPPGASCGAPGTVLILTRG